MTGLATRWRSVLLASSLAASALTFARGAQVVGAASPPPPTAYTGEATQLTTSSATLKGSAYPSNQQTSYYFQYGQSASYEAQTPTTSAGSGTKSIPVTAPVTGLLAGTAYHYRLVATNASGTVSGHDRTFTTKKIPLTVSIPVTRAKVPYATPFTISGTLSGTGSANHTVVLQANPFPYLGGFKPVGSPQQTNAAGAFSFSVAGLTQTTQLRVATLDTPPTNSRVIVELVEVRSTLHVRSTARRGFVRLYGTVSPAQPGAVVRFQLLRPHGRVSNVGSVFLTGPGSRTSRFSKVVRIHGGGLYRAFVQVASGAQVSNHSRPILIG